MSTPPAVRWIPDGEHAGVYLYAPILGVGKWRRTVVTRHGVRDETVDQLPVGTQQLIPEADLGHILDAYRSELQVVVDDAEHQAARDAVLIEVADAGDYSTDAAERALYGKE